MRVMKRRTQCGLYRRQNELLRISSSPPLHGACPFHWQEHIQESCRRVSSALPPLQVKENIGACDYVAYHTLMTARQTEALTRTHTRSPHQHTTHETHRTWRGHASHLELLLERLHFLRFPSFKFCNHLVRYFEQ